MRLKGKCAVVTGGRGGIGRAIVDRFLTEGATVYAADLSPGGSVADDNDVHGRFVQLDVSDESRVEAVFARIRDEVGMFDVLVNAAGTKLEGTIAETTLQQWNRCFSINVTGTFLTSKHALPLLQSAAQQKGDASIINFGSYDGFIADPGLAAYCASKGAVNALTRAMACDHGPEGIRVNAICPGYIDTPMLRSWVEDQETTDAIAAWHEKVRAIHPTRRYGTPPDVAGLATWLASDEARYASGQLWVLDGGLTAQAQQLRR